METSATSPPAALDETNVTAHASRPSSAAPLYTTDLASSGSIAAHFCDVAASAARAKSLNRPLMSSRSEAFWCVRMSRHHAAQRRREGSRMRSTAVFKFSSPEPFCGAVLASSARSSAPLNGTSG